VTLKIGDRVEYIGEDVDGEFLRGEIIGINKNSRDFIISYFVKLDIGLLAQFRPQSLKWRKVQEKVRD